MSSYCLSSHSSQQTLEMSARWISSLVMDYNLFRRCLGVFEWFDKYQSVFIFNWSWISKDYWVLAQIKMKMIESGRCASKPVSGHTYIDMNLCTLSWCGELTLEVFSSLWDTLCMLQALQESILCMLNNLNLIFLPA